MAALGSEMRCACLSICLLLAKILLLLLLLLLLLMVWARSLRCRTSIHRDIGAYIVCAFRNHVRSWMKTLL